MKQKGMLVFDLEEPEAAEAFRRANKALDLCLVIHEFTTYLRKLDKWGIPDEIQTRNELVDHLRDHIWSLMEEYSVDMDDILS